MSRPSREQVYIAIAFIISERAKCERLKVGAVITMNGRIVSSGYNGPIHHESCQLSGCDITKGCVNSIHAEANAIAHAAKYGIGLEGAALYCTDHPCFACASLIIQSGIRRIYYARNYREQEKASQLLIANGIEIFKEETNPFIDYAEPDKDY